MASKFALSLTAVSAETLRDAAAGRVFMGTAIGHGYLEQDAEYKALAAAQYDLVTAENGCKWGAVQAQQGQFDFSQCDSLLDFARSANASFRGHNLCWGVYNPGWLQGLDGDGKRAALKAHIKAVAAHYGQQAFAWDVVNEAITDDGSSDDPLKSNDWYPAVPDYIDVAFTTAREAFGPDVKLFYNDYSADSMNSKSDRVYALVQGMLQRGVPIDGVGLQMHIDGGYQDAASVKQNMQRLAALGLEIHITELDVQYASWSADSEQDQARIYKELLQACLDVPACKSFETWGFTDKYTWRGSDKKPLPFDKDLKPKAAVQKMLSVLDTAVLV